MSADTKDPNAYLAREIDSLANDYHAMGNHNRAIARERIAAYRMNVDDIIETRVTGQRSYFPADADTTERLRNLSFDADDRPSVLKPVLFVLAVLLIGYAIVRSL